MMTFSIYYLIAIIVYLFGCVATYMILKDDKPLMSCDGDDIFSAFITFIMIPWIILFNLILYGFVLTSWVGFIICIIYKYFANKQ